MIIGVPWGSFLVGTISPFSVPSTAIVMSLWDTLSSLSTAECSACALLYALELYGLPCEYAIPHTLEPGVKE